MNEDKALVRMDLLPLVTNPKPASSMDDLTLAPETWETNKRLFEKAEGQLPDAEHERLAFVGILPGDISTSVIVEMEKFGFETFAAIGKYTLKLVKVLQNQKRKGRSRLNLVDAYRGDIGESGDQEREAWLGRRGRA